MDISFSPVLLEGWLEDFREQRKPRWANTSGKKLEARVDRAELETSYRYLQTDFLQTDFQTPQPLRLESEPS